MKKSKLSENKYDQVGKEDEELCGHAASCIFMHHIECCSGFGIGSKLR